MQIVSRDVIWLLSHIRVLLQNYPNLLVRRLRRPFMSARLRCAVNRVVSSRWRYARPAVWAAGPDREHPACQGEL